MASDLRIWDNRGVNSTAEISTTQWFTCDDRGHLHPHLREADARHEAAKVGHEGWSVVSQQVRFGPLEDHGTMW